MSSTSQQTPQPFLWSQRCQNLPRFKIYRSGNCVCFSDAPSDTRIYIVFEDENPGGYVIPVSGNCFCPTIDMAQFIQHGKWIYFIATDTSDVNTIYACTDYIDNFYASMDLSIKPSIRFGIITELAPKNVYAVLEIQFDAPLPFPNLPFLTSRDMCWANTACGYIPYMCRDGYALLTYLTISEYCENNNLKSPDWTETCNTWITYLDAEFSYQQNRIVIRKVFDETTLFNPINTGFYCLDDAGRQIPIRATWLDMDDFVVLSYNEVIVFNIDSNANIVCEQMVDSICLPTPTSIGIGIGNPFKADADDYIKARQLIGLQLNMVGALSNVQDTVSRVASAVSTTILNALNVFPFYVPTTPTEGLKPINESFISFLAQAVVSNIEGVIDKAVRIVIKNIARTYMVLKTYFELGLSVPTSALILFLNNFIKLIADIACKIASKCIGFVSIVLTIPYAVKRLREVAEQEYDIKKPLTSIKNMFIGFGEAVRDIFTTWLASLFAGAVLCTFAKCPKLQPIQPPFIHLPDWYVFEDFCADLCRTPLIEGRIRDYMTCVNKCVTSFAPRSPTESVVVSEAGRTTAYVDESITLTDVSAYSTVSKNIPINTESVSLGDTASTATGKRETASASESIGLSETHSYTTATRTTQSLGESASLSDAINAFVAQRIVVNVSEGSGISEAVSTQIPSVVKVNVSEGFSSSDEMPEWVPFPPITPYARWIEAVNEYIDPYYGTSTVATDTLTGEVITVGEIGKAFHSTDLVEDTPQIIAKPPIHILPSDTTEKMLTELPIIGLIRSATLSTPYASILGILVPHALRYLGAVELTSPYTSMLGTLIPHSIRTNIGVQLTSPYTSILSALVPYSTRTEIAVQLTTPAISSIGITIPATPLYLRMLTMSSAESVSTYILVPHSTRTVTSVKIVTATVNILETIVPPYIKTVQLSSSRPALYVLMPHATRTITGIQLKSSARLSIYTLVTYATRTKIGAQLLSPARLSIYTLILYATRSKTGAQLLSSSRLSAYILMPYATRTRSGVQLTSSSRLATYILAPHATRTKTGVQLTSPAKACAQITITV